MLFSASFSVPGVEEEAYKKQYTKRGCSLVPKRDKQGVTSVVRTCWSTCPLQSHFGSGDSAYSAESGPGPTSDSLEWLWDLVPMDPFDPRGFPDGEGPDVPPDPADPLTTPASQGD